MPGASNTGLGRGLSGILGDAMSQSRAPEVTSLLGLAAARRAPEVRRLVTELALQALSETFDSLGVMLVRRDPDRASAAVSSRIPSSWAIDDPVGFEVAGRLWSALGAPADRREQTPLDGAHLFVTRQSAGESVVAAAVLRREPFAEAEQRIVDRLLRSVSTALGDAGPVPPGVTLDVDPDDSGSVAVRLSFDEPGRAPMIGRAEGAMSARTTAAAALGLCSASLSVRFAGTSLINGHRVHLVVVEESGGGPLFGLSVGHPDDPVGPAEAALAAAAVIGIGPFSPGSPGPSGSEVTDA